MKLQTIVSAFQEEITNRALRAIVRDYTEMDIPVCDEEEAPLEFYSKLTSNPFLDREELSEYGVSKYGSPCGVRVGDLLLIWRSYAYDEENEPGTMFSVELILDSESPAKEEKKLGITIRVEEPNALAELIRSRIWPDEHDRYFGMTPPGVPELSQRDVRNLFPASWAPREADKPWGFSIKVDDITVDIAVYWDGDGTMVMHLRQEGSTDLTLINSDCKKSYGWERVKGRNDV